MNRHFQCPVSRVRYAEKGSSQQSLIFLPCHLIISSIINFLVGPQGLKLGGKKINKTKKKTLFLLFSEIKRFILIVFSGS